jgi:AhpD family alkylhydroperoxidase
MTRRFDYSAAAPEGMKALAGVYGYVARCGLAKTLIELAYLRASQINGCAFCIQMHVTDSVKHGESHMRIHLLDAWRESPG